MQRQPTMHCNPAALPSYAGMQEQAAGEAQAAVCGTGARAQAGRLHRRTRRRDHSQADAHLAVIRHVQPLVNGNLQDGGVLRHVQHVCDAL